MPSLPKENGGQPGETGDFFWMNTGQVADYLQVCRQTVYELVDAKALPCRKLGPRNFRFKRPEVDAWLERKR